MNNVPRTITVMVTVKGKKKKGGLEKEDIKRRRGTVLVSSTQLGLLFIV